MSLISLFVSQTIKMAQLEGRICELEKSKLEANSIQQKTLINVTLAMAKPSFAAVTKNMVNKEPKMINRQDQLSDENFLPPLNQWKRTHTRWLQKR
ncbi:hypothetical protein CEXT_417071 [Caerostris extrusa]|uniref:Uncharacterized protein n=1 Tax=Caerostris extrusa TaxID=172846 RepID=A0AAV4U3B2_CAEEX|nr:hypothetical protein CEXT_417071 [Caerostris extrusa]